MTISQREKQNSFLHTDQTKTLVLKNGHLLILLAAEPGKPVGDHDVKLRSTLNDVLALLCGDIVGDFRTVGPDCNK